MTGNAQVSRPIVLTTDFGTSDAFVGVMKGVILSINPNATILDLTHEIGPQNLRQGAFVLGTSHSYFPHGAIHVAVVDPGVGTDRRPVVLETPTATFIAPDNGLLSEVVKEHASVDALNSVQDGVMPLLPPLRCWELSNSRYQRHPVSNTFHGRDIFAPAAAHVSLGLEPEALGPAVPGLIYRPLSGPSLKADLVVGEVIYVDRFGNLVTNVLGTSLPQPGAGSFMVTVEIGQHRIAGLSRTFHAESFEKGDRPDDLPLLALVGSNGYLEIAVCDGNASQYLGFGVGEEVRVSLEPDKDGLY